MDVERPVNHIKGMTPSPAAIIQPAKYCLEISRVQSKVDLHVHNIFYELKHFFVWNQECFCTLKYVSTADSQMCFNWRLQKYGNEYRSSDTKVDPILLQPCEAPDDGNWFEPTWCPILSDSVIQDGMFTPHFTQILFDEKDWVKDEDEGYEHVITASRWSSSCCRAAGTSSSTSIHTTVGSRKVTYLLVGWHTIYFLLSCSSVQGSSAESRRDSSRQKRDTSRKQRTEKQALKTPKPPLFVSTRTNRRSHWKRKKRRQTLQLLCA